MTVVKYDCGHAQDEGRSLGRGWPHTLPRASSGAGGVPELVLGRLVAREEPGLDDLAVRDA